MNLGAAYFDALYRSDRDPWGFETSPYEAAKYATTVQALGGRRFARALEIGCSIGVLTCALAKQCDTLLGLDISAAPLVTARARCANLPNASFRQAAIPQDWPEGCFDLIVLSEVLYFLPPPDIATLALRILASLAPHGFVLLVNWLGPTGTPCDGDTAAQLLIVRVAPALGPVFAMRTQHYRLDLLAAPYSDLNRMCVADIGMPATAAPPGRSRE